MRKLVRPFLVIAALAVPSVALAATNTDGVIKSIDTKAMTVMLENGQAYHLPQGFKLADVKVGEKVRVTWDKKGNANEASALVAVK